MQVERLARGIVVVRVVHAPGDGSVVVAEDGEGRHLAHEIAALVGRRAVADGVAEADELIDGFRLNAVETAFSASMFECVSEKMPILIIEPLDSSGSVIVQARSLIVAQPRLVGKVLFGVGCVDSPSLERSARDVGGCEQLLILVAVTPPGALFFVVDLL